MSNGTLIYSLSLVSIAVALLCFLIILVDILWGRKQHMVIMNFVWPVTALYAGVIALFVYFKIGRASKADKKEMMHMHKQTKHQHQRPFWQSVVLGTLHCGSGCTIGDIISEIFLVLLPVTILGSRLIGRWTIDYVFAFAIGIIFQYYAIKPMKQLSSKQAIKAALKADTVSLSFWQIGMCGWMAISIFLLFHHSLEPGEPVFWFMMQVGMLLGFCTAYPVNWWLIKKGVKEAM